jgi:hypothetical protein
MSLELQGLGRALILLGVMLAGAGLVLLMAPRVPWIGRLPGDILIERQRFTFYFPLASCLVASILLSLAWWLFSRLR